MKKILTNIFSLQHFVAPSLIQFIYWIGILVLIVAVISTGASDLQRATSLLDVLGYVIALLLLFLFWRIICEVTILFFRIHQELQEINRKLKK